MKKKALLIDVSAVVYRAHYSLLNMKNSKGLPTGALYGFCVTLLKVINELSPDFVAGCFDVSRDSLKRRELYEGYKLKREAMPDELVLQMDYLPKILDGFNIKSFKIAEHEADDVIATLARMFEEKDIEVYILTGDKDLLQLISENVKIIKLTKGIDAYKIISTSEDVREQLGVIPQHVTDLLALQGDTSDNIPGIKGIGPKGACKLISDFGTLENIYQNLDKLTPKLSELLTDNKEIAFLSKQLAIINDNIGINTEVEALQKTEINKKLLNNILSELEFKSLIKRLNLEEVGQLSLIERAKIETNVITDSSMLRELLKLDKIAIFYYENAGFGFSNGSSNWYLPATILNDQELLGVLKELFLNSEIIGYNIKQLMNMGFKFNKYFDVMLAYHLLNTEEIYTVEKSLNRQLGIELQTYKETFGKGGLLDISLEKLSHFMAIRAHYLYIISAVLMDNIQKNQLSASLELETALVPVLSYMECNGIKIDVNYFKNYSNELNITIKRLETELYAAAGKQINLNSPKQLAELLFVDMGLNPPKKTKTGYSTDTEVLEELKKQGVPIAEKLLEFRQLMKLKSTYVDALPVLVDNNDRLHTTYNQDGTATGRLSSSNPNLQNIPSRGEEGAKIRRGFIAEAGNLLISADYSQIELRILAELSSDDNLIAAFKSDMDLHRVTASKIFEVPINEVKPMERQIAKVFNFSVVYGKTAYRLAQDLGITPTQAKQFIDKYFEEFSKIKKFIRSSVKNAEELGYVKTMFGRKREISGINNQNKFAKLAADRMAVNAIIQGSQAEIIKIAMVELYKRFKEDRDIKIILQVHDELMFEVKEDKAAEYLAVIKDVMENSVKLDKVEIKVNAYISSNLDIGKN